MQVFVKYCIRNAQAFFVSWFFLKFLLNFSTFSSAGATAFWIMYLWTKWSIGIARQASAANPPAVFSHPRRISLVFKRGRSASRAILTFLVCSMIAFCDSGFFISSSSKAEQALLSFSRTLRLSPLYFLMISASSGFIAGL